MNQITTTTTKENNKVDTKIFNFNGQDVRVLGTQDEPLFVARDVALILGYSDSQAMTRRIDADDLRTCTDKSSGQAREVSALTESGLYSAILGSTKPEAKAFKRCVTSEILPSIRKHGIYATAPTIEAMLNDPDVMIKTLTALTKGEGPFEGFHDGKLEWDVDDGHGEEDSDPSCGNYALSLVDGRNASLTERGYASLVCDAEDLAALKKLAKLDRRTIRQFFKKIVADELARSMPRSTDTAAEKEGL